MWLKFYYLINKETLPYMLYSLRLNFTFTKNSIAPKLVSYNLSWVVDEYMNG